MLSFAEASPVIIIVVGLIGIGTLIGYYTSHLLAKKKS